MNNIIIDWSFPFITGPDKREREYSAIPAGDEGRHSQSVSILSYLFERKYKSEHLHKITQKRQDL